MAEGATNEQIARDLSLGRQTVRTHLNHAYGHLGVLDAGNPRVMAAVLFTRERGHDDDAR